ncbi:MAG TPA: transposase [Acidimicrobiales bacterium]|nr:transposase [Acidimicrobiales bacterium]
MAHERKVVPLRDLACFGRPARLVWRKRRWRCVDPHCAAETWTEGSEHVDAQVVLTRRAGAGACCQAGELARPVAIVAAELGVCWWTVMNAVVEHGTPLVDDPDRIGAVTHLGVDETSILAANRHHATVYATGLVDLQAKVVIDMVEGNRAADLRRWTAKADRAWLGGIEMVATDLAESFRAGLVAASGPRPAGGRSLPRGAGRQPLLGQGPAPGPERDARRPRPQARPAVSHPQAVALGSRATRRGRPPAHPVGPASGQPRRRGAGCLAGQGVGEKRVSHRGPHRGGALVDKAIVACAEDDVPEIVSLGNTLARWRAEILAHHDTGASNGLTEGLNLCVKKVKRCRHGFRTFEHHRLRVLLHAGGVNWPRRPRPPRIQTRARYSNA